ncbi:MAG: ribosome silencing factor [Peptococcaceae bacterium]|nr:ribosome silencing factor [Peptococcaceae bacterium]
MVSDPRALVETVVRAADDVKGFDIVVLDISQITTFSDYFVIISGRSTTHVKAIADRIRDYAGREGVRASRREGYDEGRWILLDYDDVVVHVFLDSERAFYNLERLWGDAPVVDVPANL